VIYRLSSVYISFALQIGTLRFLGTFLVDPVNIPVGVIAYVATQLSIADLQCIVRYAERIQTQQEHTLEIRKYSGYKEFSHRCGGFALMRFLYARIWIGTERPSVLFDLATAWLPRQESPVARSDYTHPSDLYHSWAKGRGAPTVSRGTGRAISSAGVGRQCNGLLEHFVHASSVGGNAERGMKTVPEDIERLSPLGYDHINLLGRYTFSLSDEIRQGAFHPLREQEPVEPVEGAQYMKEA
jgi:hypothetical protein